MKYWIRGLVTFAALLPHLLCGQSGTLGSASSPVVNSAGRPMAGANIAICQPLATTAASVTSNVAVLTMASNPITAGFAAGMTIQVSGFTGADTYFNGGTFTNGAGISSGFTILSVTSTTITYALTHANASATTNGTVLQQGNATTPCAGESAVYSDAALSVPITQPIATDGLGNWNAFVFAGLYYVQFYGSGITTSLRSMQVTSGGEPRSSDAIQYVSPNGNDSNDGLSMGTAKLTPQAAINALSSGKGTVYLANGTYALTNSANEQIKITNDLNFICQSWNTILQVGSSVGAIPVIHIVPSGSVGGVRIQDCTIQAQSGTPGSYAIQVDTSPNNNLKLFVVEHNQLNQLGTGGIWMNNTNAEVNGGLFDGQIEHNYIAGGILGTSIGDSLTIAKNLIQGTGTGIDVSFTAGSSTLRIEDNTINPTTNAAIHIGAAAIFTQIQGNEFETPNSSGAGSNGAFVDLDGTMANAASAVDINHNSFQIVNSSTLNALRINWSAGANIRDNFFERGVGAKDIVVTANATGTRIRPNNFNGDTLANAISSSSGAGQTLVEGCGGNTNPCTTPLIRLDANTGEVDIAGANPGNVQFGASVSGANYLYDQLGNISLASVAVGSPPPNTSIPGFVAMGGFGSRVQTKSTNYTLQCGDGWVNVTGTTTITVPHAGCTNNQSPPNSARWVVFNSGSNTVTVQADSGNINGGANITLAANTGKEITCDGTNCFAH